MEEGLEGVRGPASLHVGCWWVGGKRTGEQCAQCTSKEILKKSQVVLNIDAKIWMYESESKQKDLSQLP